MVVVYNLHLFHSCLPKLSVCIRFAQPGFSSRGLPKKNYGGLASAGHQVPPKLLYHSPRSAQWVGRKDAIITCESR